MSRQRISSGSTFEAKAAYSRVVVDGDFVFVAGTTGYDYDTMTIQSDIEAQTEQCFRNIESALKAADSAIDDIVRVTYILPNRDDFPTCWPVLNRWLGDAPPAATMFEARLLNDDILIEIEVTARRRSSVQEAGS
ncbi:MAG: RidA family protein [Pseudomonadota bacterium]